MALQNQPGMPHPYLPPESCLTNVIKIFATLSSGAVHVLYSPRSSIHGALLPLAKMPRTTPRDVSFTAADLKPVIYTPDALPMYADKKYGESLHQKEKRSKKFKPMEPIVGAGRGGRLGASATQSMVQTLFPYVPLLLLRIRLRYSQGPYQYRRRCESAEKKE